MIPPPTPVPIVITTTFSLPLAAPFHISPRAAALASFNTAVFTPNSLSNLDLMLVPSQFFICPAEPSTMPSLEFMPPVADTPIPAMSVKFLLFSSIKSLVLLTTVSIMGVS